MRPLSILPALTVCILFGACQGTSTTPPVPMPGAGSWRMELDLRTDSDDRARILPFLFDLSKDGGSWSMTVHNGEEVIVVDEVLLDQDTFHVRMPLFDSEFIGKPMADGSVRGHWYNHLKGPDHRIPFVATPDQVRRFRETADGTVDLSGDWECHFASGTADAYPAIGIFRSSNGRVTGTFGTETGDYRYLDGVLHGDSLLLSAFDGSHAFLFEAALRGDSLIGSFLSGTHSREDWFGVRHEGFLLRNPDSLTFLKEGYDMVDIRLPDLRGDTLSIMEDRFAGHVRMVQIMGSWCPNCVDETILLREIHNEYHDRGLDVFAVAFERSTEPAEAIAGLMRFKNKLDIPYPILYGGPSRKEVVSGKLPFLDHIMSYPTCIFIDRAGKVRRIRTGFYGPGTGRHYEHYRHDLRAFLEKMLAETPA